MASRNISNTPYNVYQGNLRDKGLMRFKNLLKPKYGGTL